MADGQRLGQNGGPPLEFRVDRLETRSATLEEQHGAVIRAISDLAAVVRPVVQAAAETHQRVERMETKLDEVISESREGKRRLRELEDARYRDRLDSAHEIEDTQRRAIVSAADAARAVAKAEADAVRLEHAREALAEVKDNGRWLQRFIAEKGVSTLLGALGAAAMIVITYLVSRH